MKSTALLTFLVICHMCLLVASLSGHNERLKKTTGDAFATDVERALDTLDQVFRTVKHVDGLEGRDVWSNAWDSVKTYWDQNKEQIISTAIQVLLSGRKRSVVVSDTRRSFSGALE